MAPNTTYIGVHDHGFNNVSTYGALRRFTGEGCIEVNGWEKEFYELTLKSTGAVQAARWIPATGNSGFFTPLTVPLSFRGYYIYQITERIDIKCKTISYRIYILINHLNTN